MSNWIDCTLDVLAASPKEINDIAAALLEPSRELLVHASETQPPEDAEIEGLRKSIPFPAITNLGYVEESVNKARRFKNSFEDTAGDLISQHLAQVSVAFPNAIFLLEYRSMVSQAWKEVMRNGVVEKSVREVRVTGTTTAWMLLDIFAPFRTEYEMGLPFGSMWSPWVADLAAAADTLRKTRVPCTGPGIWQNQRCNS